MSGGSWTAFKGETISKAARMMVNIAAVFFPNGASALAAGAAGAVSECAFGPHAALAKKPEMLMYNMYTPLSELSAALPADQIHHSDPPPGF